MLHHAHNVGRDLHEQLDRQNYIKQRSFQKHVPGGFPGGTVVGNPPANAGDMGLSPGPGGSHMPRGN